MKLTVWQTITNTEGELSILPFVGADAEQRARDAAWAHIEERYNEYAKDPRFNSHGDFATWRKQFPDDIDLAWQDLEAGYNDTVHIEQVEIELPPVYIGIHLDGGLVQDVYSTAPEFCPPVFVIDYDTEGADDDDVKIIPQLGDDGKISDDNTAEAVVSWYAPPNKWGTAEWFEAVKTSPTLADAEDDEEEAEG